MNRDYRPLYFTLVLVLVVSLIISARVQYVSAQSQMPQCQKAQSQWGVTLDGAWLSLTSSGNWEKDVWFYIIKPNTNVIVQIEKDNYYLICYEFSQTQEPLFGWVEKSKILLHKDVTPAP